MFAWLYRLLFARRVKWALMYTDERGNISRWRALLYDPTREEIEEVEENYVRPLIENGWTVLIRPRRLP